jgi:hypothetical protein
MDTQKKDGDPQSRGPKRSRSRPMLRGMSADTRARIAEFIDHLPEGLRDWGMEVFSAALAETAVNRWSSNHRRRVPDAG